MKRFFYVLFLILFSQSVYATTPTISNVTGTVANGQTLTITGSNMVQDQTANWLPSSYFPGVNVKDFAYMTGLSGNIPAGSVTPGYWYYGNTGQGVYDSAKNLIGSGSTAAKVTATEQCTSGQSCGGSRVDIPSQNRPANYYVSSYIYFTGNFATQYQKFWLSGPGSQFYLDAGVDGNGNATGFAIKDGAEGDSWTKFGSVPWTKNTWHYWELEIDTTNYSGDRFTVWWDGIQSFQHTFSIHSGAGNWYSELGVPNWSNVVGAPTQQPFSMWIDRYVTSSSRINPASKIEIGTSSTYHGGTYVWQEPVALADGSIQVKTTLPAVSGPYYLFITSNTGEHSVAYNISGSTGGNDVIAPVTVASPISGNYPSSQYITLTRTDNVDSPASIVTKYCWGSSCTPTITYTVPLAVQANTLRFFSTDTSGNVESPVVSTTYTIQGTDVTPPNWDSVYPSGILPAGTTSVTIGGTTSESCHGKWGLSNLAFGSLPNTFTSTDTTVQSQNITGLANGASYHYYAGCQDAAGNISSIVDINFTIADTASNILVDEPCNDNNWTSRGWYDNTTQGLIVAGGHTGNALRWFWAQGETTPTNGGASRLEFPASDDLTISFWVLLETGWEGSHQNYHPHMMYLSSDQESAYEPLAANVLQTYFELGSLASSPYTTYPKFALQDEKNVNINQGTTPNNLVGVTETRSNGYCNTPIYNGAEGICYDDPPPTGAKYSAFLWTANSAPITTGTWHHVQYRMKMNTIVNSVSQANGILQILVDDVLKVDYSNMRYRTNQWPNLKWNKFTLAGYIGSPGSPKAQAMQLDDILITSGGISSPPPPAGTGCYINAAGASFSKSGGGRFLLPSN